MKKSIIYASAIAILCGACEMKDELWSNDTDRTSQGLLNLNVSATQPESMTRASISTDNFIVDIVGKDDLSDRSFSSYTYGTMPNSIALPEGGFTLTAHTPGDLEKQMNHAYYRGTADVTIVKNMTSKKTVDCTMVNSRVSVSYSDDFTDVFKTWTITIDDGSGSATDIANGSVMTYTNEDMNPADVFWYFDTDVATITVNFRGKTQKGNDVESSSTYTKKNCEEKYEDIENDNFTGGDAITVNFAPVEDGKTGSISGINIIATVTFDNYNETVTLHVKDIDDGNNAGANDPDTPDTPTGPITISEPNGTNYLVDGVVYTQDYDEPENEGDMPIYRNYPTDVALHFEVPNGLQNLYVLISGTDDFNFMTGLMGLTAEPYGLDLTDTADKNRNDIAKMNLFTMPTEGMTQYDFAFSDGIWSLLPAFVGEQRFKLRAVDSKGNMLERTLVVTIIEKQ